MSKNPRRRSAPKAIPFPKGTIQVPSKPETPSDEDTLTERALSLTLHVVGKIHGYPDHAVPHLIETFWKVRAIMGELDTEEVNP